MQVHFTTEELFVLAAALHAVAPSGGGSREYTLARRVTDLIGGETDALNRRIIANIKTAATEAAEYSDR